MLRCGLIGTVRYEVGERILPAARTTPESLDVHDLLWQMRSAGCKAVAMEVSSHALMQARVRGVEFDAAVFTNLTQDHLDYHKTMDAYFEAKATLFSGLAEQQKKKGKAVINLDDRYGAQLVNRLKQRHPDHYLRTGRRMPDFRASNVRIDFNGTSYQLDAKGKSYLVRLPLIGQFNVYNSLAAIAGASVHGRQRAHGGAGAGQCACRCPAVLRRCRHSGSSASSSTTRTPTMRCSTSSRPAVN
ncbi:MAG: Mur ligase family protein [Nibricoccus sp.]